MINYVWIIVLPVLATLNNVIVDIFSVFLQENCAIITQPPKDCVLTFDNDVGNGNIRSCKFGKRIIFERSM